MPLAINSKAPHFTLKTKNKEGIQDWRFPEKLERPLVLLFFPMAFSKECTDEFCHTGFHGIKAIKGTDAVGVSPDSPFVQEAWKEENKIEVPLLSDYELKVSQLYGVYLPDLGGLGPGTARAAIVIDTKGIVRYIQQTSSPLDLPDFRAIRNSIKTLLDQEEVKV